MSHRFFKSKQRGIYRALAIIQMASLFHCSQSDFAGGGSAKKDAKSTPNSETPADSSSGGEVTGSELIVDGILVTNCESGGVGSPLDFEKIGDKRAS